MKMFTNSCLLVLLLLTTTAQAQTRIDPQNPDWQWLRPWGEMHGQLQCQPNKSELWGQNISPIGDANHDHLVDFVVERDRCDTIFDDYGLLESPHELFLYKGKRGSLPTVDSGLRIGPTEIGSRTLFLAANDWDKDGNIDLATVVYLYDDSSFGNTEGKRISSVVIWWGNAQGEYSLSDTTHLSCGCDAWFDVREGFGAELNQDSVGDLCLLTTSGVGFTAGRIVHIPRLTIFQGHDHARWGRGTVSRTGDWAMWTPPSGTLSTIDQECDGIMDIAFMQQGGGGQGVAVMYGRHGQLPDTTDIESVRYYGNDIHGVFGLFTDLSGDGVPELAIKCDSEVVKVYAGKPGQRLIEQLNNGFTALADVKHPYSRPWATVWMPNRLHDGWTVASDQLLPLGDANNDGINDLWAISQPFIICYDGGQLLDSLIDGELDMRDNGGYIRGVVLGDVDGSGKKTYAMELGYHVLFFKPDDRIPSTAIYRQLPHPDGFRCEHASAVVPEQREAIQQQLQIVPNPARGEVLVRWNAVATAATLVLTTVDGRELYRVALAPQTSVYSIATDSLASGLYFITLTSKEVTMTSTLLIP